ncbi:hypothetical protein [Propionicimonas paludicola]|uniref:hypothetical protein n=1 Tax=Propionicimonas paludicola TaxID=185243 RepID=UPI00117A15D8|nr:hypothetical protein [Propionicimonas paludicola]
MSKRVCGTPGCPNTIDAGAYRGLCDECRKDWDKARGSRTDRGYGAEHQAERARILSRIVAGEDIRCVTCNKPLDTKFHLGHNADRTGWIGGQCPTCNDSEAGKAAHI